MFKKILIGLVVLIALAAIIPFLLPEPNLGGRIPEQPFTDSRFTEIEGVRVHWRERGSQDSERLVVLLHGFGGSAFSWRHSLDALEQAGYHVIAPDLPPFGYSERTARGPEWASLMRRLAEQVAPGARWTLVGHSMGVGVAADMASAEPDRIDRLIMVDGTPALRRESGPMAWLITLPPVGLAAEYWASKKLVDESSINELLESALGRAPTAEELAGYHYPLTIPGTYSALLRRMAERQPETEGWEQLPIDVIWGERDEWLPRRLADRLVQRLPGRIEPVYIEGAGHNPMDTHPEELNELLLERIQPTPAPGGL
ncbi:alpha/beta fold hydrolase [Wenzhouxiangella marina]|uniref:Uncharacterized protein n=1 Tax=Wenzhouxiangella marina TaxID=1579979 RepID=A0A0K0XUE7_9GAMM|nr:alpha/beta hydrolase [Wenzhouxiangella marina]AKS41339.1 hypothetical protein WM2015_958 [Wenzhouxiangella marina]MBB6086911.1 2-hydroxymuconate-semialdehyde hydrolase [Wenzhouxiangella marina]